MRVLILGSYVNANTLKVSTLPQVGESLIANEKWSEHGGKGFNVGIALRRLTNRVELLLPIGQDSSGDAVVTLLKYEGIATDYVIRASAHSGFGVGFVADGGANFLAIFPGANARLKETDVENAMASIHSLGWLYAQLEIPQTTVLAAFKKARTRQVTTVLNPSPMQRLGPELISLTDVLIVNESEAMQLLGIAGTQSALSSRDWLDNLPRWADALPWQNRLLIVTLAERGCIALTDTAIHHQHPWSIREQDATGAGDAFNAGFLYGMTQGLPIAERLRFACACGALVASKPGVLPNLPTLETIEAFIVARQRPAITTIARAAS